MVSLTKKKQKARCLSKLFVNRTAIVTFTISICLFLMIKSIIPNDKFSSFQLNYSTHKTPSLEVDVDVDPKCANLPQINPSGVFFLDNKIKDVQSDENLITPTFHIGSTYGDRVKFHMTTDTLHYRLIKELLENKKSTLAFDFGANQGFFTYFLAALGMEVHAFEINQDNFDSLQHGKQYNSKEIADRVHLYPIGMDNKISRFSLRGSDYGGFLKEGDATGPILGITFDCFAYHSRKNLDLSNVGFVKLDVEGFEIAVLMGASKSLFTPKNNIGGMLMEVGPKRWGRAKIKFETGVEEMIKLTYNFKHSYIILRTNGGHHEGCPPTISEGILSDTQPTVYEMAKMYKVNIDEWKPLLAKMEANDYDCNFWYTN